jgi:cold shock CspA family protein
MMSERVHGTLKTWIDDRGFGFIVPDNGGKDVFVLGRILRRGGIAFPRAGMRLTFEIEHDELGRDRAVDVQPEDAGAAAERVFNPPRREPVRP